MSDCRKDRRFMEIMERGTCAAMCNARVASVGDGRHPDICRHAPGATARRLPRYLTGAITRGPPGKNAGSFRLVDQFGGQSLARLFHT